MNPKQNAKFTSQEYWDERFAEEDEYEWLGSLADFEELLDLAPHSLILVAGCGNSRLSQDLEKLGHFVVSTDFAPSAALTQKNKYQMSQYVTADCRALIFQQRFDLVIEKGVFDAMVADDNPWDLTPSSRQMVDDVITCARSCAERFISIYRVCSPAISLINVSTGLLGRIRHRCLKK